MKYNILIGGKAGQGPNVLSEIISRILVKYGYSVFLSREYGSVIRGGHNYNILTFSDSPISSNDEKIDLMIALDENTKTLHKNQLKKDSFVLFDEEKDNIFFAGALSKILSLDFKFLEEELKQLKRFEENIVKAKHGYESENTKINLKKTNNKAYFQTGSQGLCEGSIKSGLDIYYAYPMTPATPLLFELAPKQIENNFITIELENEISVAMAALGSAATGAKAMIGTSGGGFDLMTEALSMSGQAEIPLVAYLASRPGPGTGVPTGTSQGDLDLARHHGHGEFFRLVVAPGSPDEAQSLTSESFYFSQKFKIPSIILGDKHLAESFYTLNEKPKITPSLKSTKLIRFNSYEHENNERAIATEDAEIIQKNFETRSKKTKDIEKEASKFQQYKIYGKKDSKNIVVSYGSTKGAILDSIKDLDIKFLQVLYIEPFSEKIKTELQDAKKIILVENSATAQLAKLIAEKTGILIEEKNQILKFNSLPFYADELSAELKARLK